MKGWLQKNKVLLIVFLITTILLILVTYMSLNILIQSPEMIEYLQSNELKELLNKFGFFGVINLIIFGFWILFFLTILWKIYFPSTKAVKDAFCISEIEFIFKLPSQLRKELKKLNDKQ